MNKKELIKYIQEEIEKIVDEEEEMDEATTTGDIAGYQTPNAFARDEDEWKRRRKKHGKAGVENIGYSVMQESIEPEDYKVLRKIIRAEIADLMFDLFRKKNVWM